MQESEQLEKAMCHFNAFKRTTDYWKMHNASLCILFPEKAEKPISPCFAIPFSGGGKRRRRGASALGSTVQGAEFGGAQIWNSEILHSQLSVLVTVDTNSIVVTTRITIGRSDSGDGGGNKDVCPGRQTSSRRHRFPYTPVSVRSLNYLSHSYSI